MSFLTKVRVMTIDLLTIDMFIVTESSYHVCEYGQLKDAQKPWVGKFDVIDNLKISS